MNKETAKTVLIAFAATSVALAVVISGYTLAFASVEELDPLETSEIQPESEPPEHLEHLETTDIEQSEADETQVEQDPLYVPDSEYSISDTSSEHYTPVPQEYIVNGDYDYEVLLTLKSIEYQLKIIAGGIVLAVISLFIWFTILKPIKRFTNI